MEQELKMPKYGITMTDGEVLTWFKHEGQVVEKGEAVLEFRENKAIHEIVAEESGVLTRILVQEGQRAKIGATLGIITS